MYTQLVVDCIWNMMSHTQKPYFVFRQNGWVHLNRRGRQFSRLLAAEVCTSALVMLHAARSEVVWEYWLPTPFASFPFTSPPVCHHVPSVFIRTLTHLSYSRAMSEVLCHVIHYVLYFPVECKHKNWQWGHKSGNISRAIDDKGVGAQSRGNSCIVYYITQCSCRLQQNTVHVKHTKLQGVTNACKDTKLL